MNVKEYLQETKGATTHGATTSTGSTADVTSGTSFDMDGPATSLYDDPEECATDNNNNNNNSNNNSVDDNDSLLSDDDNPDENNSSIISNNNNNSHHRWHDITSSFLHGELSDLLGAKYLSIANNKSQEDQPQNISDTLPPPIIHGLILTPQHRLVVAIPCRRAISCPPGVEMSQDMVFPSFRHILFVVDTSSRESYLSVEAMQALSSVDNKESDNTNDNNNKDDDEADEDDDLLSTRTIPDVLVVQFLQLPQSKVVGQHNEDSPFPMELPWQVEFHLSPASFSEVNVLGGTVLSKADITTNVRQKQFSLQFLLN